MSDATKSSNTGARLPVTLPAKPGTLETPSDENVIDHGDIARLEEDWRIYRADREVPQADHLRYNLRPRRNMRPPDRWQIW